jgi:hypothetical protein
MFFFRRNLPREKNLPRNICVESFIYFNIRGVNRVQERNSSRAFASTVEMFRCNQQENLLSARLDYFNACISDIFDRTGKAENCDRFSRTKLHFKKGSKNISSLRPFKAPGHDQIWSVMIKKKKDITTLLISHHLTY